MLVDDVLAMVFTGVTRTERLEGKLGEVPGNNVVPLFKDNDLSDRIMLRAEAAVSLSVTIREDILFLRGLDIYFAENVLI